MKRSIVKLRILGMATFLFFLLSCMFASSPNPTFNFSQLQQALAFISFASFAIVMLLQVYMYYTKIYNGYIKNYGREEDE